MQQAVAYCGKPSPEASGELTLGWIVTDDHGGLQASSWSLQLEAPQVFMDHICLGHCSSQQHLLGVKMRSVCITIISPP
jgi:hypothetical protein